jgi:hypothetical protein
MKKNVLSMHHPSMVVHFWVLVHSGRGPDILIADISLT